MLLLLLLLRWLWSRGRSSLLWVIVIVRGNDLAGLSSFGSRSCRFACVQSVRVVRGHGRLVAVVATVGWLWWRFLRRRVVVRVLWGWFSRGRFVSVAGFYVHWSVSVVVVVDVVVVGGWIRWCRIVATSKCGVVLGQGRVVFPCKQFREVYESHVTSVSYGFVSGCIVKRVTFQGKVEVVYN